MKTLITVTILFFMCQLIGFSQSNLSEYKEFNRYMKNTMMSLKFEKDTFRYNSYSKKCTGGRNHISSIGTYKQKGRKIELTTSYSEIRTYTFKDSIIEEVTPIAINKNKEFYEILEIDSVIFLLKLDSIFFTNSKAMWSTNDYMFLISKINQIGNTGFSRVWSNCKKEDRFFLDKSIKKYLPQEWKNYVLENPIEATIIESVSKVNTQNIVTINQGEIHGVQYGIKLYNEESQIRIFEVSRETSKGYLLCAPDRINYFLNSKKQFSSQNKRLLKFGK